MLKATLRSDSSPHRFHRNIVILQDTLRPGGTERQSVWLSEALQTKHFSAHLVLLQRPAASFAPAVSRITLQKSHTPFPWFAPRLIRTLRALEADLVLCMGRNANSYGAWIRHRLPRVKVVSTCRTNRGLPLLYRIGIRASDFCVTNSEWGARELQALGLKPPANIRVIPNALLRPELLELDRSPAAVAAAREQLGLPLDRPILCNIASFVPGKNKEALLRAFAQSQEARPALLLLAGSGPELGRCRKLADRLDLDDQVCFLGHTEAIDLVLQSSDLFVSTALRDGLPNALVEAQASGLPVVAFDTAGAAESFIHRKSGWSVPAGDENGFAEAIAALLHQPDQRQQFALTARAHARNRFHPQTIAAHYHTLIEELLEEHP